MSAIEQIISALLNVDESPPSVTPIDVTREREREKAQQEQMFFYNSRYDEEEEENDDDEGQDNTGGTENGD